MKYLIVFLIAIFVTGCSSNFEEGYGSKKQGDVVYHRSDNKAAVLDGCNSKVCRVWLSNGKYALWFKFEMKEE